MTQLNTQVSGPDDAPAVVLIHSLATSSGLWSMQVPVWRRHLRLVVVDLPGHGASAALDGGATMAGYAHLIASELDRLGIHAAALVGLSLGSMVAQAFALAYPDRTRALVLAHGAAATGAHLREVWDGRIAAFRKNGFATEAPATIARWFTAGFVDNAPLTVGWIESLVRETSGEGYIAAIEAIQQLDHSANLHKIRCPTLVIAGEHDVALPPSAGAAIAATIPQARFAVLKGAAHLGNVEQPEAFTELAGAFLREALA
ncbi:alpha/beta fold hydrolase [Duganella hordei]|uniref:alpha/beta fold hydrolase n=1 Tax=Duganella hordei TaxID=2865934 RepID=UPI0030E8A091